MIDILIVGAGPTGLTLACDLARRGIPHRVIERFDGPSTASRAKTIQPRALEVMDDLGVVDRIKELGATHVPTRHYDRARVVSEAVEAAIGVPPSSDVPHPAPIWISEPFIEGVLRDRLTQLGGQVEFGAAATSLIQYDDHVAVSTGSERIHARYVVGCDGGQSTIRRLTGIAFEGTTYDRQRWHLGDLEIDGLDRHCQHVWMSPEHGVLSLFPLPSTNLWQFQASIDESVEEPEQPSLELFRRIFAERAGVPGVRLHSPGWQSLYRINVRMAERYRDGRVFLAGDAAHVHSPGGGQGMNTGIQDSYNLGWKLAAVLDGAPDDLLDTYQEERIPVARKVLEDSTARGRMVMQAAADNNSSYALRNLTDDFTTGLTIAYPDSSLNLTDHAGTRAPGGVHRGPDWAVVADGNESLLVRPDGYIAACGPLDTIEQYQAGSYARFGRSQRSTSSTDRPRRTA